MSQGARAYISEIYASVQGEGPSTGEAQIFVRLAGCPLRCTYCDTPNSLVARGHPSLTVKEVLRNVSRLNKARRIRTVSITGGEPLAHIRFLEELLPALQKRGYRVYLETAGVHPQNLNLIEASCDVIAMDMKLPSAVGRTFWTEHEADLKDGGEKVFV